MINITSNEFKRLQGRHNDFESPTYDMRKGQVQRPAYLCLDFERSDCRTYLITPFGNS